MKLYIALAVVLLSGSAVAAPARHNKTGASSEQAEAQAPKGLPPRLYDFKGVPLEISLDDFRNLVHPDGLKSVVVCTGEKSGGQLYSSEPVDVMVFDETELKLGVKKCIWVYRGKDQYLDGQTAGLSLLTSGFACNFYSFDFIADPKDHVMRLFRYKGTSNVAATDVVISALTTKFGAPVILNGKVQNKVGNSFDQTTAMWVNPMSTLMVQDRYLKIDDLMISVEDTRLKGLIDDQKKAEAAAKPNGI